MNNPFYIEVGVTQVMGEESEKFLHSLVSSDVTALQDDDAQPSLLLNPSGKTISTLWIHRSNKDEFLLVSPIENQEILIEALKRFLIRTKATVEPLPDVYFGALISDEMEGQILIEKNHCGSEFNLVLIPKDESIIASEFQAYENFRISYGAVSLFHDLGDESIAQEASLEKSAVSFNKGCFVGQELVCRIDSRSASTPFSFFSASAITVGVNPGTNVISDKEVIGNVTSVVKDDIYDLLPDGNKTLILKLSRKGIASLAAKGNLGEVYLDVAGNEIPITNIEKVAGNFSC